jgi:small GTP-binding protein
MFSPFNHEKGSELISLSTLGFNVDTVEYRNVSFTVWDVGGPRPIWRQFYRGTSGLIFVVDSNDFARLDEARSVLHSVLQDNEMQDVVVLILANKQDLPDAVSAAAMCDKLQLRTLKNECYIQSCTAMTSAGLFDSMDWLSKVLSCRKP